MSRGAIAVGLIGIWLGGCGASTSGAGGETTPTQGLVASGSEARFQQLEGDSVPMDPEHVSELPEVSEDNILLFLEATISAPERDPVLGGFPVEPPAAWTVGATEEGQEVRVEFMEPEGGAVVMTCEAEVELGSPEITVTWIVRYERRNVRLTEAGTSEAIHVTPVAARMDVEGGEPMFWISSEAPEPAPE